MNDPVVIECSWVKPELDDPFLAALIESMCSNLDVPPKLVLGSVDVNHWSAWKLCGTPG